MIQDVNKIKILATFLPQVTTVFQLKSNETRISECELLSQPEMQNQYICYCFGTFEATVRGILSHQVNVYMRNQHPKSQTIEVAQIKLYENQGTMVKSSFKTIVF